MRKNLSTFFVWLRNGFCFAATWLLLLAAVYCLANGIGAIPVGTILRLLGFVFGGALLFSLWFSPFPFKKMSFIGRLSGFFALFVPLELAGFYAMGLFTRENTTAYGVLIFLGIALAFYLACLLTDRFYYRKKSEEYNESLKKYQSKRRAENGEE